MHLPIVEIVLEAIPTREPHQQPMHTQPKPSSKPTGQTRHTNPKTRRCVSLSLHLLGRRRNRHGVCVGGGNGYKRVRDCGN